MIRPPTLSRRRLTARRHLLAATIAACYAATPAWGLPTAPAVVHGSATFAQNGNVLNVTNSNGAIINWNTFNIGANQTTRFIQPSASSAVLNRVVTSDPSYIYGRLLSNGKVWLVNPGGIVVGPGGRVDTAAFVASTLNVSNQDFLAGRLNFQGAPGGGNVLNQGTIVTPAGGTVYLVGANVSNEGIIRTPQGETILAAGQTVDLIDTATPGVRVEITGAAGNTTNLGEIVAAAGQVGVVGVVVRNSGQINASSVVNEGGRVFLRASRDTYVDGAGRIVATGAKGGRVEVLGDRVAVMDQASIDASGSQGGGTILVGGDYQGGNPAIANAGITYFGADASLRADAVDNGDGGRIIVWADGTTRAHGSISARGGAAGGNGGFVETSGHYLEASRAPDLRAPRGSAGEWLLDPENITITASAFCDGSCDTNISGIANNGPFTPSVAGSASILDGGTLAAALANGGVVTVDTTGGGTGVGNIVVEPDAGLSAVNVGAGATLNLKAHNNIAVNGSIVSVGLPLNMNLIADQDHNGTGAITVGSGVTLNANNANVTLSAYGGISIGANALIATGFGGGFADLKLRANATGTEGTYGTGDFQLGSDAYLVTARDLEIDANSIAIAGTIKRIQNNPAVGPSMATLTARSGIAFNAGARVFENVTSYGFDLRLLSFGGGVGSGNISLVGTDIHNVRNVSLIAGWDGAGSSHADIVSNTAKGNVSVSDSRVDAKTIDWVASGNLALGAASQTVGVTINASDGADTSTGQAPLYIEANNIVAYGSTLAAAYGSAAAVFVGTPSYYGAGVLVTSSGGQEIHADNAIRLEAGSVANAIGHGGAQYGGSVVFASGAYQRVSSRSLALYGGVAGHDNFAMLAAYGDQEIALGSGAGAPGVLWLESQATGSSSNNVARIEHGYYYANQIEGSGAQTISIYGGGSATLRGGAGNGTLGFYDTKCGSSCSQSHNDAAIKNQVGAQTIDFVYGGSLTLIGGSVGNGNSATIDNDSAALQRIGSSYGAGVGGSGYFPSITATGGSSGGNVVWGGAGYGGVTATDSSVSGGSSTVTVDSSAGIEVGNAVYVDLPANSVQPSTPFGFVTAVSGNQVTLSAALSSGTHSLTFAPQARQFRLENAAGISSGYDATAASSQQIYAGSIALSGGGNASTVGGAYIGGATNISVTAYGNVTLTGGASNVVDDDIGTGAAIGNEGTTHVALNVYGGALTLNGGTGSKGAAFVGSFRGGGSVAVYAANGITLNAGTSVAAVGSSASTAGYGETVTMLSGADINLNGSATAAVLVGAAYGSGSGTATSVTMSASGDIVSGGTTAGYGSYIGVLNGAGSGAGANSVVLRAGYGGGSAGSGGSIDLDNSAIATRGGSGSSISLATYGTGSIQLEDTSVTTGGSVAAVAGGNATLTNAAVYGGATVAVRAGWDVATDSANAGGGNISLSGGQVQSFGGNILLAANHGSVNRGGIYNIGTVTTAPLLRLGGSGAIVLSGREIGLPDSATLTAIGQPITLDPASGTVTATADAGGINLRQTSGDLATGKYVLSAAGTGNHIHLQSVGSIDVDSVAGFAANTQDDTLILVADGTIGQSAPIVAAGLYTTSVGGTVLNGANQTTRFSASNSGSGDIELTNNSGASELTIIGITNHAQPGDVAVDNIGGIASAGAVTASFGSVSLTAHSPISVDSSIMAGAGDIALSATTGITLGATASLSAPTGSVEAATTTGNIVVPAGATVSVGTGGGIHFATGSGTVSLQGSFVGATPTTDAPAPTDTIRPVLDSVTQTLNSITDIGTEGSASAGSGQTGEVMPAMLPAAAGASSASAALSGQTIGGFSGQFGGGEAPPASAAPDRSQVGTGSGSPPADTKDAGASGKEAKDSKDKKDDKKAADTAGEKRDDKASGRKPVGKCSA